MTPNDASNENGYGTVHAAELLQRSSSCAPHWPGYHSSCRPQRYPEWYSACLVSHGYLPFPWDFGSSHAHRADPASPACSFRRIRRVQGRQSARGSEDSPRLPSPPYSDFANVASRAQSRSAGDGRTSWTVVFPIPRHILQADRPRHLDSLNRSGRDVLVRERGWTGRQVCRGQSMTRDCALGSIGRFWSRGAPGETRGCDATRI